MSAQPTQNDLWIEPELALTGRIIHLREMYWQRTYHQALVRKPVAGGGENTLLGHARDFAALLQASDPFIQPGELIVGSHLAIPQALAAAPDSIHLGEYDRHYPPGHATILRMGLAGIRDHARARLQATGGPETDPQEGESRTRREFLRAVEIAYDAACAYVARYAVRASEMAASETDPGRRRDLERIASVCHELAVATPSSFHAALQLVQFTRVFGGHGCVGRFDQWMYPFYKEDIEAGKITRPEAAELLQCLFIKMNEFADVDDRGQAVSVHNDDLRNIALAGQTPDGQDACNELTYMCLQAAARLMLPEPKLNARFYRGSPRRLLWECCRVLAGGSNVLAIFNDEVAIPALSRLGIPLEDARDYCNDGCSELIIGGKSTITFWVHDALPALSETVLQAAGHPYATFDEVMAGFKSRLIPFMRSGARSASLSAGHGRDIAITFPYMAASIQDCLEKASPAGVRYSIWGSILAEVGNAANGLAAIKKLIYEDRSLAWDELIPAVRANYAGYEPLRQRLLNRAPKYGNDDDEVDMIAQEIAEFFCDGVHARAHNPAGCGSKQAAGLMCFQINKRNSLPASPDGRRQGDPIANSFSPAPGTDKSGPTAVLNSVAKVDLTKASHGSVLDIALHTSVVAESGDRLVPKAGFVALIDAFLNMRSAATLQVNVIDRDTLLRAREHPDLPEFRTLIVRVWGFSAAFVELPPALQDHVLARTEHGL